MPKYAEGGKITGPSEPSSDSIPAWLSDGCTYLVHVPAKHPPLLEAINAQADSDG